MYLHERENWWKFTFDSNRVMTELGKVRAKQGLMLGRMSSLGFDFQEDALLSTLSQELVSSSEIEGETLDRQQVRSSIARRLGIETAGMVGTSRYVEGVVEMLLDATQRYAAPLTDERLYGWHNVLFPSGMSGLYRIEVARYRSGEMQVVSGAMGKEKVHYEAPKPERVPQEMQRFIDWVNAEVEMDEVVKAAIAHLWFVTIHPFDDGNGRIARALTDMILARSEQTSKRFYSMSAEIKLMRAEYYEVLERTQRGKGDITEWLLWFFRCFDAALDSTEESLSAVLAKARYWEHFSKEEVNERQRKLINLQFDGFFGKLTSGKWAKIGKCSSDTALNDIKNLLNKGMLVKNGEGGRSTNYSLPDI
ncbi:MAG: Fic family protein [Bacteroides sp.]|nr:Fic family protein [Bacteroides sp.]